MRRVTLLLLVCLPPTHAQWQLQASHTTADLRGIDNVGHGIAWASGSHGTVLRTLDGGATWQTCATPPDAEALDFRGIQAFDKDTAIVMSSGKGDLSRLYKTSDGCKAWALVLANPYIPEGFFDALLFLDPKHGILFGDPSLGRMPTESSDAFRVRVTADGGVTWGQVTSLDERVGSYGLHASPGESAFAASNSSMAAIGSFFWFATSKSRIASRRLYESLERPSGLFRPGGCAGQVDPISGMCGQPWITFNDSQVPITHGSPSAGIFSIHFRNEAVGVAVGGDYKKPDQTGANAAYSSDYGQHWIASKPQPHGYRSAVAYDAPTNTWITVGPNGTDVSTDDGRHWRALKPSPQDDPEADGHWNALSLPFVVGPHGRIGILRPGALKKPGN